MTSWIVITVVIVQVLSGCYGVDSGGDKVVNVLEDILGEDAGQGDLKKKLDDTASKKDECVTSTNDLRKQHVDTDNLQWDRQMANDAQAYAENLRDNIQKLEHDSSTSYGENLYWGASSSVKTCGDANKKWYEEYDNYDYATGTSSNGKAIGHFTQLVWKKTTKFGVGIATGSFTYKGFNLQQTYIVARYSPAGNLKYTYKDNVGTCKAGKDCSASATKSLDW